MSYHYRGFTARTDMIEALQRYVTEREPVGDFLSAVLCNDLTEACGRGDDDNLRNLPALVAWLYNEAPPTCWGSPARMAGWLTPVFWRDNFKPGQQVRYVPYHAHGDLAHPDCDDGVVTSTNEEFVFVSFRHGQSQACKPDQLQML